MKKTMNLWKLPVVTGVWGLWGKKSQQYSQMLDTVNSASLEDMCVYSPALRNCEQYQPGVGREPYRMGASGAVLDEQSWGRVMSPLSRSHFFLFQTGACTASVRVSWSRKSGSQGCSSETQDSGPCVTRQCPQTTHLTFLSCRSLFIIGGSSKTDWSTREERKWPIWEDSVTLSMWLFIR